MSTEPEVRRIEAVDALRGVALVSMVLWHTADGWLTPTLRSTIGFLWARRIGGYAAPLFLILVGVSLALSRSRPRRAAGRGIALVAAGYGLSLMGWLVDGLGIATGPGLAAAGSMTVGGLVLVWGCRRLEAAEAGGVAGIAAGALGVGAALWLGCSAAPAYGSLLLRVDVLHLIGLSLLLLGAMGDRPRLALGSGLLLVALTPAIASLQSGSGHVAAWLARTEATQSMARFPVAPWLAYPIVGFALGAWLRVRGAPTPRTACSMVLVGIATLLLASELLPYGYRVASIDPAIAHSMRLAHRVSVAVALFGAVALLASTSRWLAELGRHSLIVYTVHLELAYGIASRPVHERLGWAAWAIAASALLFIATLLSRASRKNELSSPTSPMHDGAVVHSREFARLRVPDGERRRLTVEQSRRLM